MLTSCIWVNFQCTAFIDQTGAVYQNSYMSARCVKASRTPVHWGKLGVCVCVCMRVCILPCVSGVGTVTCTPSRLQRWPQGSRVTTPPVLRKYGISLKYSLFWTADRYIINSFKEFERWLPTTLLILIITCTESHAISSFTARLWFELLALQLQRLYHTEIQKNLRSVINHPVSPCLLEDNFPSFTQCADNVLKDIQINSSLNPIFILKQ